MVIEIYASHSKHIRVTLHDFEFSAFPIVSDYVATKYISIRSSNMLRYE